VTGICSRGPFIQLPKYLIEGLIPLEELGDDWWEINQDKGFIRGRRTGVRFRIGDPARVAIVSADPVARRLNFTLVKEPELHGGKALKKGGGPRGLKSAEKTRTRHGRASHRKKSFKKQGKRRNR
jgi:ribonuclease R